MGISSYFSDFFSTLPEDEAIINNEIRKSNFTRMLYISTFGIILNLFHIVIFRIQLYKGTPIEVDWRRGIIITHSCVMVLNIIFSAFAFYLKKYGRDLSKTAEILIYAVFLMIPFWGASSVSIDQMVTPSITAFILTALVTAIAFLMPPVIAFFYFGFSYALFIIGISLTQRDPAVLLTNQVNGFTVVLACFAMSVLFWKNNLVRYRQSRLIERQKTELEKNNESLAILNATKDKFFSIISHDLRGPISGTLSLTEFINSENGSDNPDERKHMMTLLQDNLGSTYKLLENLLYWSETQTGSIGFNPEQFLASALIDANIELLKISASNKNVSVINKAGKYDQIFADEEMINTVFRNLISNAVKFSFDGGVVEIDTKSINLDGRSFTEICVSDHGTGIDPVLLNNMFKIDSKTSIPGTNQEMGSGLGLILCKEFIAKHGGSIRVESIVGKGSVFCVTLPDRN